MRPRSLFSASRRILQYTLLGAMFSCASQGTISSSPPAEIFKLNSNFESIEKLGMTPIKIGDEGNVARYSISQKGQFPDFVMVVYPDEVKGELLIKSVAKGVGKSLTASHKNYLNLLLRAHRLFLKGNLREATQVLTNLDHDFDTTFGSLYLSALVDMVEGRRVDAQRKFQLAKNLYPGAEELNQLTN